MKPYHDSSQTKASTSINTHCCIQKNDSDHCQRNNNTCNNNKNLNIRVSHKINPAVIQKIIIAVLRLSVNTYAASASPPPTTARTIQPFKVWTFFPHMHDHIWEADNNCYLGKLCRLELNRSKIQPSLGTMRRLPQRCFYQCHQHQCRYIQSCAKTVQYPIIEPGNDQCHDNTCHADDGLFFKKYMSLP